MNFLYNIIIKPIEMLIDLVFSISFIVSNNVVVSIAMVSLVINLIVLPLYKKSDAMQEEERQRQKHLEPWVKHIRSTFKGDERFMMLSEYYRRENYKPVYALKGTLSLLFQIPFFIAAYNYLSTLYRLEGASFLFLSNLAQPDGLIQLGNIRINFMPILMTVINIISGMIYTKGFTKKEKLQLYGMAGVFLVLLFNSPSGLVLYWTLNNLFSLLKNIFMKVVKNPKAFFLVLLSSLGLYLFVIAFKRRTSITEMLGLACAAVLCEAPAVFFALKRRINHIIETMGLDEKPENYCFIIPSLSLITLWGLFIPSNIISASPLEFFSTHYGPIFLLLNTFTLYLGLFLWIGIFYCFASNRGKNISQYIVWAILAVSIINVFFFGEYGRISPMLVYDNELIIGAREKLVNLAVMFLAVVIFSVARYKFPRICKSACGVILASLLAVSLFRDVSIQKEILEEKNRDKTITEESIFSLSTKAPNVIVFMLDRAISAYIPYIFEESPELYESFDGFVYYPNTISSGAITMIASPQLFGGYEYTPEAINNKTNQTLVEKHNEALKMLPVLFAENGYESTVVDPPYANYKFISDISIFDDCDNVKAYNTTDRFHSVYQEKSSGECETIQKKNFFIYSIFRSVPIALQNQIYYFGTYLLVGQYMGEISDLYFDSIGIMENLSSLTEAKNTVVGNYLVIQNEIAHSPTNLSVPDYLPIVSQTQKEVRDYYESVGIDIPLIGNQLSHYQVNHAAMNYLAQWFDYLKEKDVYDNTRIVIVSDHGYALNQFEYMRLENGEDIQRYNSLLMVKDFNSKGKLSSNYDYMTTADVPALAVNNLIDNPVNPFTGKVISSEEKKNPLLVCNTMNLDSVNYAAKERFQAAGATWYELTPGNIFDSKNWKIADLS